MKRVALYSSSHRQRIPAAAEPKGVEPPVEPAPEAPPVAAPKRGRVRSFLTRHPLATGLTAGLLAALALVYSHAIFGPQPRTITQKDIDAAVLRTLETKPLPSRAAQAYELIKGSVVRVRGLGGEDEPDKDSERSVGTGVVILDNGTILTNLHVVAGAKRLNVVFSDGMESEATVVGTRPEDDLAVIKTSSVPDDLMPATLRSTADLRLGDEVVAVGFPFGIGPSVSSGVVSGLRREYRSPEGKRLLTNLIQFDAAANPGSSGGPLFTTDGEVVGIVTGILNPGKQAVFIGIGFAVPIENAAAAAGVSPF
ncbi:MAG TPA: trypsin-like peptidase domain-containing protein [Burkholderiales bacterium]|nr:trypsin-like peptidase domain-containing protein [Burkholderiales bacterium]